MAFFRNLAAIAVLAGAYATNPDEKAFQDYVEGEMKKEGSTWLERKVVSHIAGNMYKRENYYLFSMIKMPDDRLTFIGAFGHWFRLPRPKE